MFPSIIASSAHQKVLLGERNSENKIEMEIFIVRQQIKIFKSKTGWTIKVMRNVTINGFLPSSKNDHIPSQGVGLVFGER
ncbi:MAG TPA: hypothetical protein PLL06_03750 [Acidobacteriota bacterium]|nr:hypothetical protein [Acidobacteriota bacterium]HMZ78790.1 hypothetical protein [Acidobacteriota bacterium]HNC43147.1 hypothetical protein [Acidobacteriota bacterium]